MFHSIFGCFSTKNGFQKSTKIGTLGPPPPAFRTRSKKCHFLPFVLLSNTHSERMPKKRRLGRLWTRRKKLWKSLIIRLPIICNVKIKQNIMVAGFKIGNCAPPQWERTSQSRKQQAQASGWAGASLPRRRPSLSAPVAHKSDKNIMINKQ